MEKKLHSTEAWPVYEKVRFVKDVECYREYQQDALLYQQIYRESKKHAALFLGITLANVDRFSIFFVLLDSTINTPQFSGYISRRTLTMSLHYLVKRLLRTHSTFNELLLTNNEAEKLHKSSQLTNLYFKPMQNSPDRTIV